MTIVCCKCQREVPYATFVHVKQPDNVDVWCLSCLAQAIQMDQATKAYEERQEKSKE